MIFGLFRKDPRRAVVGQLLQRIVAASRAPALYDHALGIPDTVEGRFEALALHVVLVLRRLRRLPAPADEVAQDLVDAFFRHVEASLREMGVGDMGVPRRMKRLAQAFYGRASAYDAALDAGDAARLADALARNVLAGGPGPAAAALAAYVAAAEDALAGQADLDALLAEGPRFAAPGPAGGDRGCGIAEAAR